MLRNKRVLTVDDSRLIRVFVRNVLTEQGAEVDESGSGEEALTKLTEGERYDLLLLDLMLPGINGIEVLSRVRQLDQDCTVVMLTGVGGAKSAIAAVRQGADAYIEKQDLIGRDNQEEFVHALETAQEHRAGIIAQHQLEQVKADFYAMVAHDLRNPAGNVRLAVKRLLDGKAGELTEKQHQLLSIAVSSADTMLRLIDNYLDYTKIEAGFLRLDTRDVDMRVILEAQAWIARAPVESKRQTLKVRVPKEAVRARVDPERINQLIDNLISNAIKYTPEEGEIELVLSSEGGYAVLRVSDTGQGIPPTQLGSLFTKYHRVPGAATRGVRGTGLGLLIVKELSEGHGGTVYAESEGIPGKGTTFTVRIPLWHEPDPPREEDLPEADESTPNAEAQRA